MKKRGRRKGRVQSGELSTDYDLIHKVGEEYWQQFGKLVGETLMKVPHHMRDDMLTAIEDRSSAHGSDFARYLDRPTPFMEKVEAIFEHYAAGA